MSDIQSCRTNTKTHPKHSQQVMRTKIDCCCLKWTRISFEIMLLLIIIFSIASQLNWNKYIFQQSVSTISTVKLQYIFQQSTVKLEANVKSQETNVKLDSGQIVLFHPRKAGGTAMLFWMRKFLEKVARSTGKSYNVSLVHREGWLHAQDPGVNFIQRTIKQYPNALYLIVFRDPIERILSQFEFEYRWGCQMCNQYSTVKFLKENETHPRWKKNLWISEKEGHVTNDTLKYEFSNVDFTHFLDLVQDAVATQRFKFEKHYHKEPAAWDAYLSNYYLFLFCCNNSWCSIDNFTNVAIHKCFTQTVNILKQFDILLVTEWLNDRRTQIYVNKVLTAYLDKIKHTEMEYNKSKIFTSVDEGLRFPKHPKWTRSKIKMISNNNYKTLHEWNKWDTKLYKYCKRLSYKRIKSVLSSYNSTE